MAGFSGERLLPRAQQRPEDRGTFFQFDPDAAPGGGPYQPRLAPDMLPSYITSDDIGFSIAKMEEARASQALSGRNYLIIGAGPGSMGGAAALELVAQGANVMTVVRPHKDGNVADYEFAVKLTGMWKGNALFYPADATATVEEEGNKFNNKPKLDEIFAEAIEQFGGKLDGVIITIGVKADTPFHKMTLGRLRTPLEANALYPAYAASLAERQMLLQDPPEGQIVILTSAAGIAPVPGQANYGMGKGAANHVVRVAHRELSMMDPVPNIGIKAFAPGIVDTKFVAGLKPEQTDAVLTDSHADRGLLDAEAGAVLAYLVSPDSEVSGKIIEMVGKGPIPLINEYGLIASA